MRSLALLLAHLMLLSDVQAQPAPASVDLSMSVVPSQLVDVGGRRLNLLCLGSGSPTVVFATQLGEAAWNWAPIHAQIAKSTRACIYDRAGLGFSDPSNRPGTVVNAAQDLAELLSRSQERPPYVLVGASYGAMVARYFAAQHSRQVSALVLVDGHHEDSFTRIDKLTAGKYAPMMNTLEQRYRHCVVAARKRIKPGSSEFADCVEPPPNFANRALSAVHFAQSVSVSYWESALSEWENLNRDSADQVRSVKADVRDVHILALIRSISPFSDPTKPPSALSVAVERENVLMQQETAALSATGSTRIVPKAGHGIHFDNPAALVEAVLEAVARARR